MNGVFTLLFIFNFDFAYNSQWLYYSGAAVDWGCREEGCHYCFFLVFYQTLASITVLKSSHAHVSTDIEIWDTTTEVRCSNGAGDTCRINIIVYII